MKHGLLAPPRGLAAPTSLYPATKAGTLEKPVLLKFEHLLDYREKELIEEQTQLLKTLQLASEGHGDEADRSVFEIKDNAAAVLANISQELPKVQSVLRRVRNDLKGDKRSTSQVPFGKCLEKDCGTFIERERLDAIPIAPTCITHTRGCGCVGDKESHRN